MENAKDFVSYLRQVSDSNMKIRKEAEHDERMQRNMRMADAMDAITDVIKANCKERMENASRDGYYYATLFTYNNMETVNGFKTVFLMKGPMYTGNGRCYGSDYFKSTGIVPVIDRISEYIDPMYCFHKYDRVTKEHSIVCSWKP